MNRQTVKLILDSTCLDEALKKVHQLKELLEEIQGGGMPPLMEYFYEQTKKQIQKQIQKSADLREDPSGEWKEKEAYYDDEGRVMRQTWSKDHKGDSIMKTPLKITAIVEDGFQADMEELEKLMGKVDRIRDVQPLADARLIIKC